MTAPTTSRWWPAPRATAPLDAAVSLPGSKSLTNRALVLAALASGPSVLRRPLVARDTALMVAALRAVGTRLSTGDDERWRVDPADLAGPAEVDCGLAGTVMRFLPPVAALAVGTVRLDGDARARERPLGQIVSALRDLGVDVEAADATGRLPLTVHGTGSVRGGPVTVDAASSSQFVSALLLAAPRFDDGLDLRHVGPSLPSRPHVQMTVSELRRRGVDVEQPAPDRWQVRPGPIAGLDTAIEPDLSSAAPFLAAALASGGRVRVRDWPERTDQAGDRLRELLAAMGAQVCRAGPDLEVVGTGGAHGAELDLHEVGELTPVLAAVCALADGPSRLTGIGHLRGHETDRLAAVATEINRLGGDVTEHADGLGIRPRALHGGRWHTYADHRMAQAGAVLGLAVDGVEIEDVGTTAKTFPGFADAWSRLPG